jgi:myo-inositol-1(or 4)-monophosphatase
MRELEVAKHAAQIGGDIVAKYFHEGVSMRSKKDHDLVSDADIESEQAIVAAITKEFPGHAFVGEESHRDDALGEHVWIIDPLDGTTNFAHKIPHFAVSIAYYERGEPKCGVIYNPLRQDWYEAVKDQGAMHNGLDAKVNGETELSDVLIGVGFYYDRGAMMEATLAAIRELFTRQIHGIRRFGTASLDLCQVGMGMFGAFFEYELSPWDFAAGRLFVEEAGGRVTTCRNERLPVSKSSVLASNGQLHEKVLQIVEAHCPR